MKKEIRNKIKGMRKNLPEDEIVCKSNCAAKIFLKSRFYNEAKKIMLYMRLGNETDTTDIIKQAFKDEKDVIFPVTDAETATITAFYADEKTSFKQGGFSVFEPQNTLQAQMTDIDVVIVPGIAFDKTGGRIGFGKGCYDKFLQNTDAIKIGFCYEFQLYDSLPVDDHDVKMDYIITEEKLISCK